ncbi:MULTISPECIES: ATP phosphoribosyltransferase [unclassified Spirosoma]|uniref:ATP phosphoribosyltransferase n=1 Tax=unclassified Spirosoma TaxID=2621999 RepID=UPI00095C5336|nr:MULTISPECIES: ATP phosphoribosyltransferase [unclassified Spirosoma]MBN8824379.1 ATP phosphoribosyltransferase [Spirosoma sp.]OJW70157.1 MAG: ATP phosphoribosyltransferase [Spirosoma sp. 48-14]
MSSVLRIALQKSGRLSEDSYQLFKECGIRFDYGTGKLKSVSSNFPAEFLFLRDDDIPGYVEDGVADLGIVGENVAVEMGRQVQTIHKLGFSKCRLSIAVPRATDWTGIQCLEGKNIATSYPNLLGSYLTEQGVRAEIHEISGSVEIAPSIGLAEAVCDIVSSGSTLLSNGLKEVETIFRSEAILIAPNELSKEKQELVDKLLFRIKAVQVAKNNKYIVLNAPNDSLDQITALLPGMKSPTVTPLATEGWSSVHSVLNENEFWENIEAIRAAGAEGILVIPIEKMIY